jgi:geranylgeranyl pyrophosphate synthase
MIERKTGAEVTLFAALPAILGGATPATVEAWRDVGMRLGAMVQASSDVVSAVAPPPMNDLLRGKSSLAVFACRQRLAADEREAFDRDLSDAARGDHAAVQRAIARMVARRSIREALAHIQLMLHRLSRTIELKLVGLGVDNSIFTMIRGLSAI